MDDEIVAEFATKEAAHGIRLDTPPAKLVAVYVPKVLALSNEHHGIFVDFIERGTDLRVERGEKLLNVTRRVAKAVSLAAGDLIKLAIDKPADADA
jgi:hypothetical protein